jgi:hypothetical protein
VSRCSPLPQVDLGSVGRRREDLEPLGLPSPFPASSKSRMTGGARPRRPPSSPLCRKLRPKPESLLPIRSVDLQEQPARHGISDLQQLLPDGISNLRTRVLLVDLMYLLKCI